MPRTARESRRVDVAAGSSIAITIVPVAHRYARVVQTYAPGDPPGGSSVGGFFNSLLEVSETLRSRKIIEDIRPNSSTGRCLTARPGD
jgi:hypothetical protein